MKEEGLLFLVAKCTEQIDRFYWKNNNIEHNEYVPELIKKEDIRCLCLTLWQKSANHEQNGQELAMKKEGLLFLVAKRK